MDTIFSLKITQEPAFSPEESEKNDFMVFCEDLEILSVSLF